MLVKLFGAAVQGIDATIVTIEVNSSRGIKFFLVGLPDSAVKESHERIISALQVNGYKFPSCQLVINMAPADIRKEGSSYDLPLAIGILAAAGTVSTEKLGRFLIIGELGLDGAALPGADAGVWDRLIGRAQDFSADVCRSHENYISPSFAANLRKGHC